MLDRNGDRTAPTSSWLHVAGFLLVLWAVSSDALARAGDVLVTEIRGSVVRAGSPARAIRALDVLKVRDRIRIASGARAALFISKGAVLYEVDGPLEIVIAEGGPKAVKGELPAPRALGEMYKGLRVDPAQLVQGSLVMRGVDKLRVVSPEGAVAASDARTFRWTGSAGPVHFELATDSGDLLHRTEITADGVTLPEGIELKAGTKYVWGIVPGSEAGRPIDWTEFTVMDGPPGPARSANASDRVLYAVWLQHHQMPRAAARALAAAR